MSRSPALSAEQIEHANVKRSMGHVLCDEIYYDKLCAQAKLANSRANESADGECIHRCESYLHRTASGSVCGLRKMNSAAERALATATDDALERAIQIVSKHAGSSAGAVVKELRAMKGQQ